MSANDLLTKQEAANLLGGSTPVSISFIDQLLAKRKLPRVRLSHRVCRIPRAAIEAFIASRTMEAR